MKMNKPSNNLYESFIVYSNDDYNQVEIYDDDDNYSTISSEFDKQVKNLNLNLTRSINGCDTISLYTYEDDDDGVNTRRVTWEEWYLKKKIEKLKNAKLMKDKMEKKWEDDKRSRSKKNYTEEEKTKFLKEWLDKKKKQQKEYEEKLERLSNEKNRKKYTKEVEQEKAEENFNTWLKELKEKEKADKLKKQEDEEKARLNHERIKQKRKEQNERMIAESKKKNFAKPRSNTSKRASALINGKVHNYYDWSTSPAPSFMNEKEWQS